MEHEQAVAESSGYGVADAFEQVRRLKEAHGAGAIHAGMGLVEVSDIPRLDEPHSSVLEVSLLDPEADQAGEAVGVRGGVPVRFRELGGEIPVVNGRQQERQDDETKGKQAYQRLPAPEQGAITRALDQGKDGVRELRHWRDEL